jgi:hypothetical protein
MTDLENEVATLHKELNSMKKFISTWKNFLAIIDDPPKAPTPKKYPEFYASKLKNEDRDEYDRIAEEALKGGKKKGKKGTDTKQSGPLLAYKNVAKSFETLDKKTQNKIKKECDKFNKQMEEEFNEKKEAYYQDFKELRCVKEILNRIATQLPDVEFKKKRASSAKKDETPEETPKKKGGKKGGKKTKKVEEESDVEAVSDDEEEEEEKPTKKTKKEKKGKNSKKPMNMFSSLINDMDDSDSE